MSYHCRAFCPCGYNEEPAFGDVFFLPFTVCPSCGRNKREMEVEVVRWVRTGWFKGEYRDRDGDPVNGWPRVAGENEKG